MRHVDRSNDLDTELRKTPVAIAAVLGAAAVIVTLIVCVTFYNAFEFKKATEAGLEQRDIGRTTIWVDKNRK